MDDCGTTDSGPSADCSSAVDMCSSDADMCSSAANMCSSAADMCSSAPDMCASAPDMCSSAPDMGSSSVDPPPDYSTCVLHAETGNSNHHSGTTDMTHHFPSSGYDSIDATTSHSLHIPPSAPLFDMPPGLEFDSFRRQSSFGPDKSTTPRPNVYGRKTIVLSRTNERREQDGDNTNMVLILMCSLLGVSAFPLVVFISYFG